MWRSYKRRGYTKKYKKNVSKKTDYRTYQFSGKEWAENLLRGILLVLLLGYFFYRSVLWTCLLSPLVFFYLKSRKEELAQKRRRQLGNQFKDTLSSLNGSIQAGYSIENAFMEAYREMSAYYGEDSMIAKELAGICFGVHNNRQVEELVQDFGHRSGVDDILEFGNVLMIGKKSGGNLNEIIQTSISVISDKMETKQEIETLISAKKLEASIMAVIPFLIILYIEMTSAGYFDSLYQSMGGRILMSVCFVVYVTAVKMTKKIVHIEV